MESWTQSGKYKTQDLVSRIKNFIFPCLEVLHLIISSDDIFSGECWSGKDAINSYGRDGKSNHCIDKYYQPCKPHDNMCVGQGSTNFVYRLQ